MSRSTLVNCKLCTIIGCAAAMRSAPPAFFRFIKHRTIAPMAALSAWVSVPRSKMTRVYFLHQPRAIRSRMHAALDLQRDQAGLQCSFGKVQNHDAAPFSSSYGNSRISRTQSPSAEKTEAPQPQGRNDAVLWFTGLSASA